ncbi:MAG: C39 family peptidase, partial [Propionibacteriaceae bacterium]|nr:C39 family peptidase [Propionibacteriaceae bacterium]
PGPPDPIPFEGDDLAGEEQEPTPLVTDGVPGVEDPGDTPAVIGDPEGQAEHWFQQATEGTCVPASVAMIVSAYTGLPLDDEAAFVELASELGLLHYDDAGAIMGMLPEHAVQLLQAAGIEASLEQGNIAVLAEHLQAGRGVIVPIDAGELLRGESREDFQLDHAVVVTGIDLERGMVILNDPGHPGGQAFEVPAMLFDNAWADGSHAMIVCDQPALIAEPEGIVEQVLTSDDGWALLPALELSGG